MRKLKLCRVASLAVVAFAAAALGPVAAFAGGCPTDKAGIDVREPDNRSARGVEDNVIASLDVAKEPAQISGRLFRLRRLTIQPGGVVPWHSHGERPAIIYVIRGRVTEYASTCSTPIVHNTGDAIPEMHTTSHWWMNTGKGTAILLSADLLPVGSDAHMM
jgi:quercetin dioxygenase-like cupin family protein